MLSLVKFGQLTPLNHFLSSVSVPAARLFENPHLQINSPVRFTRNLPNTIEFQQNVTTGISEDPANLRAQEISETKKVIGQINKEIKNQSHGRLFAVVHVAGKQFKITTNDIIIVQSTWPPNAGDRLRLEKVLLAGSKNFTLVGRPLLPRDLVNIQATVIEKTLSYTKFHFRMIKRHDSYRRYRFIKTILTMVRINSIEFEGMVDESKDVEGLRPSPVC